MPSVCLWGSEEDISSSGTGVTVVSHNMAPGNQALHKSSKCSQPLGSPQPYDGSFKITLKADFIYLLLLCMSMSAVCILTYRLCAEVRGSEDNAVIRQDCQRPHPLNHLASPEHMVLRLLSSEKESTGKVPR